MALLRFPNFPELLGVHSCRLLQPRFHTMLDRTKAHPKMPRRPRNTILRHTRTLLYADSSTTMSGKTSVYIYRPTAATLCLRHFMASGCPPQSCSRSWSFWLLISWATLPTEVNRQTAAAQNSQQNTQSHTHAPKRTLELRQVTRVITSCSDLVLVFRCFEGVSRDLASIAKCLHCIGGRSCWPAFGHNFCTAGSAGQPPVAAFRTSM